MASPLAALILASIKIYYRNRAAIFFSLVVPLMIMLIFGLLDFGSAASLVVGVVRGGGGPLETALVAGLRDNPAVKVREGPPEAERAALERGDRDLVLEFPADAGAGPVAIPFYYREGQPQKTEAARAMIGRALDRASFVAAGVEPRFRLDDRRLPGFAVTYIAFLVPGIIAMSVMQSGIFSVTYAFVQFKQKGVLRRLMATPMRVPDFLCAQIVTRLIMAAAQTAILLAVGMAVFRFRFAGNVLSLFAVAIAGSAVFIAVGFAVSGWARSEETAAPLANLIVLPLMFLSGVFFSRGSMPDWLQTPTAYLPLTYVVDALRGIAVHGATLWDVRGELLGIGVWGVVSAALAVRVFRWEAG